MARKLAHVVAKRTGMRKAFKTGLTDILNDIVKKPALFNGTIKTYKPYTSDTGDKAQTLPDSVQTVQRTIPEVVEKIRAELEVYTDLTLQQDIGNQKANAPLIVRGETIHPSVPATTLMFLYSLLIDLRTTVSEFPVPDPACTWVPDPSQGLLRTKTDEVTQRTMKLPKFATKAIATDKHPEQVETYYQDVPVGEFVLTRFTGAISRPQKDAILRTIADLLASVKEAIETANINTDAQEDKIATKMFDLIFAPLKK